MTEAELSPIGLTHFKKLKRIFGSQYKVESFHTCGPNYPVGVDFKLEGSEQRFRVNYESREDKYCFSTIWPQDKEKQDVIPPSTDSTKIYISASRTDDVIFKDFARRFMADYLPKYAASMELLVKRNEYIERKQKLNRDLHALLGRKFDPSDHRFSWESVDTNYNHCIYKLNLSYTGETVNMELRSVPAEIAKAIIAVLKSRTDK